MKLYIPKPNVDSPTVKLIVELERLRNRPISGSTPPWVFAELESIFHTIESIASARVEGNHTTVAGYVETVREDEDEATKQTETIREITNIEKAIAYIESRGKSIVINKDFLLKLHRIVVDGLDQNKEGDSRPGAYRNEPRSIKRSKVHLAQWADIPELMDKLFDFINAKVDPQFDLIKGTIAHHHFTWIHPFGNGNGRVVRLLTYAMLMKQGFIDGNDMRLLSPAAVFGNDRQKYYDMLAEADKNNDEGLLKWSEYMLGGIKNEVDTINELLDGNSAKEKIIIPALNYALEKKRINDLEFNMLKIALDQDIVQAADFRPLFPPDVSHVVVSKAIRKMREQNLLRPIGEEKSRRYAIRLTRNALTLGVVMQLDKHGFLPLKDEE